MSPLNRFFRRGLALTLVLAGISSCGGDNPSGSGSSGTVVVAAASNVVPVIVDAGPPGTGSPNTLFTTVTVCVPGSTTQCQTIDHIQVDTGSYGFRVLASVLTVALPITPAPDGNFSLLECTQFADGYSWGPVASADIQVSGELAGSVPIQVIGVASYSAVPDACSSTGPAEDTVATFGANGILGIGVFEQDCGAGCAPGTGSPTNGDYYACTPAGDCVGTEAPLASQVQNPVALFAVDNNGTLIDLPGVASPGEATMSGSLIFGIDTQTNNASGAQTVLTVTPSNSYPLTPGTFTTVFAGQTLDASFIDSGSNAIFFNDDNITPCPAGSSPGQSPSGQTSAFFYCPAATQSFSATLTGVNGVSFTSNFQVANADTLTTDNPTFLVLPTLAGNYPGSSDVFDWGLPFYYGRRVATAIENHSTAVTAGPYIAF